MLRQLSKLLGEFYKTHPFSKWDIPSLPKLWHFGSSTFVNNTAMVVSYITKLGPVDVNSDVNHQEEISSGLEWYYVRSI